MPKLDFPDLTKADAIFYLMILYRKYPQFNQEFNNLRTPYLEDILKFLEDTRVSFHENSMSFPDYVQVIIEYWEGRTKVNPFTDEQEKGFTKLQPYLYTLEQLAVKWKLKAPWATRALFFSDYAILQPLTNLITHKESLGLFERFEKIIPFHSPVAPFKIELSALLFSAFSRDEIISEISDRLYEYENKIKAAGITEYPSRLQRHAEWWFEHYVKGKTYDEIAELEGKIPGGSLISYATNVGIAVRKFSKLIGIDIKG